MVEIHKIRTIIKYVTEDGQEHLSEEMARQHIAWTAVANYFEERSCDGERVANMLSDKFVRSMVKDNFLACEAM